MHGISASAMAWSAVGDALPGDWSLVALDLRGRGASRDLPGPFGLAAHAADVNAVAAVLAEENGGPVPLVGHSMGAYVAVLAVDDRPDLYARVVLVDGGVPLPVPEGVDPDDLLAATLGPALERLRTTYASEDAYLDFYRRTRPWAPSGTTPSTPTCATTCWRHPRACARAPSTPRCAPTAATCCCRSRPGRRPARHHPAHLLLVAPAGMFGQEPGLLPAEAVAGYDAAVPALSVETVPGTNHYTMLFQEAAARRVAAAVTAVTSVEGLEQLVGRRVGVGLPGPHGRGELVELGAPVHVAPARAQRGHGDGLDLVAGPPGAPLLELAGRPSATRSAGRARRPPRRAPRRAPRRSSRSAGVQAPSGRSASASIERRSRRTWSAPSRSALLTT